MQLSVMTLALVAMAAVCNGNYIQLDLEVTELLGGNKSVTEEHEIFIEDSFLTPEPPTIELDGEAAEDEIAGRETIELSPEDIASAFDKAERPIEEHINFGMNFLGGFDLSPEWTSWSCCRRTVNIMSRQRMQEPKILMQSQSCDGNFCQEHQCKDHPTLCNNFSPSMCDGRLMKVFLSINCPRMCNFCGGGFEEPATRPKLPFYPTEPHLPSPTRPRFPFDREPTRPPHRPQYPWNQRPSTAERPDRHPYRPQYPWNHRPSTTQAPWTRPTKPQPTDNNNHNLAKVTIFKNSRGQDKDAYMYTISRPARPSGFWQRIPRSSGELSSFYLYRTPTDVYNKPIHFCRATSRNPYVSYKWSVSKRQCRGAWQTQFVLYGSLFKTSSSKLLVAGNSGSPDWTTRITSGFPSDGYSSSVYFFYGPKVDGDNGNPSTPPYQPPTKPPVYPPYFTTQRPTQTRPVTFFPNPSVRPTRPTPVGSGPQPTDEYNRECLESHNFFRAVHNVPPLQWSPELARTARSWAQSLKRIAPNHPNQLRSPGERTPNWPHSESGRGHRNNGDGENIAWDLSGDGSSAKESVMRWYSEVFYYDRNHPTSSAPNKPVGHLTQMLWKKTTHLGCAAAVSDATQYSKSTWSVAHYSPGGNVRISNSFSQTLKLYNEMVPDMREGSCITKRYPCAEGNQCMAFGPGGSCQCSGRPTCRGQGCIANCKNTNRRFNWKQECQGTSECKCTEERGAVCI